jgi:CRISPR-associated protein Cmr1
VHEVTFKMEVVTPLFLAGADQSRAELRAPSFRGVLRYWLRALLGGILGTTGAGLERLWQEEEAVFGTTKTGSLVVLRLGLDELGEAKSFTKDQPDRNQPPSGRDYLFWSMARLGREGVLRWYYPEGSAFTLTLSQRGPERTSLDRAVSALWLLNSLGGLGSRSRRGAGSLVVKEVKGWDGRLSFTIPETSESLADFLRDGLQEARRLSMPTGAVTRQPAQQPLFDILDPSPEVCHIWVLRSQERWDTADDALRAIGKRLSDFRSQETQDGRNVWQWAQGKQIGTVEGIIFGVPLQFRSDQPGGQTIFIQGVKKRGRDEEKYERRASPLLLHITQLGGNQGYVGVAVLFKSQFLPPGVQLEIKKNWSAPLLNQPRNYMLIQQWVRERFPHALEVQW